MKKEYESIIAAFHNIIATFEEIKDSLLETWGAIKEIIIECEDILVGKNYIRESWIIPGKIILRNQVIIRKPLICRARSSC